MIDTLLKYVHTDAACIRYEPGRLATRQARLFDPLLAWAAAELGWKLSCTVSISGASQEEATVAAVRGYLSGASGARHVGCHCAGAPACACTRPACDRHPWRACAWQRSGRTPLPNPASQRAR